MLLNEMNPVTCVESNHIIEVDGVHVVNCLCTQQLNRSFNYSFNILDKDVYSANTDYCETEMQKFLKSAIKYQVPVVPEETVYKLI